MSEQELYEAMEKVTSMEEAVRLLNASGVEVTVAEMKNFAEKMGDTELSEESLDAVAGGGLVDTVVKYAGAAGVLCRSYYDLCRYGNAIRTYSANQVYAAARVWGLPA